MTSKEQNAAKSSISPVLFMTVDGTPMSFYLRPGPVKVKLQPLITAGGGELCNVQQPGAILLMDPTEENSINETTAHWYVSTNYINDCIEKNIQLNLEDYKLDSSTARKYPTRVSNSNKLNYTALSGGRQHYTPEEDAAILSSVSKYKTGLGGNIIWKEMEKQGVTRHSWQSMKYRYHSRLSKKDVDQWTVDNEPTVQEAENQEDKNQEPKFEKPSTAQDTSAPHRYDTESESREDNVPPAKIIQPDIVEGQLTAENDLENTDEAHPPTSPQPELTALCPAKDCQFFPAESSETQRVVPTPDEIPPTDSPQSISLLDACDALEASHVKHKHPHRLRSAHRQLLLNGFPSPDVGGGQPASSGRPLLESPKPSRKTKSSVQSPQHNATAVEEPSSKKIKGDNVTTAAEVHQDAEPETTPPDCSGTEAASTAQKKGKEGKKKDKRKLGILEMATKEFESESDGDDDPTEESQMETEPENSPKAVPGCSTSHPGASLEFGCERGADSQENLQENRRNIEAQENVQEIQISLCNGGLKVAAGSAAPATSKAHLFIFDRESQDVESQDAEAQAVLAKRAAAPARPPETANAGSTLSLSQMQLEEDKQRIRELMEETKQDLVTVAKALLKTSGDFSEAHKLLLDLLPNSGTLWQCSDDERLISGDPAVRLQLQEKYGEELLAKRVVFLELER